MSLKAFIWVYHLLMKMFISGIQKIVNGSVRKSVIKL